MISIRHIVKDMLGQRTRIVLTVLAIAWGTASISGMLAVGEGLRVNFGKAMQSTGAGLLIIHRGFTSRSYHGIGKGTAINLTPRELLRIKHTVPGIKAMVGEYQFNAALSYQGKHTFASPRAVPPAFGIIRNIPIKPGGRFINPLDMQHQLHVIVLGNKVAAALFKHGINPLGKTVQLGGWTFQVIGVMHKKLQFNFFTAPDALQVWIPSSTYVTLTEARHYKSIIVQATDPHNMTALERHIRTVVANNNGVDPKDKHILRFINTEKTQDKTTNFFFGMQMFLGMIGGITLMVAGIGIANVMVASVTKATRQIGIQMALGAKSYYILCHYICEALLTTLIGGVIGIGFSYGMISLIKKIPLHGQFVNFIGRPEPIFSVTILLVVIAILGVIGFLAGLVPARKAACTDPAQALRYE